MNEFDQFGDRVSFLKRTEYCSKCEERIDDIVPKVETDTVNGITITIRSWKTCPKCGEKNKSYDIRWPWA